MQEAVDQHNFDGTLAGAAVYKGEVAPSNPDELNRGLATIGRKLSEMDGNIAYTEMLLENFRAQYEAMADGDPAKATMETVIPGLEAILSREKETRAANGAALDKLLALLPPTSDFGRPKDTTVH